MTDAVDYVQQIERVLQANFTDNQGKEIKQIIINSWFEDRRGQRREIKKRLDQKAAIRDGVDMITLDDAKQAVDE